MILPSPASSSKSMLLSSPNFPTGMLRSEYILGWLKVKLHFLFLFYIQLLIDCMVKLRCPVLSPSVAVWNRNRTCAVWRQWLVDTSHNFLDLVNNLSRDLMRCKIIFTLGMFQLFLKLIKTGAPFLSFQFPVSPVFSSVSMN